MVYGEGRVMFSRLAGERTGRRARGGGRLVETRWFLLSELLEEGNFEFNDNVKVITSCENSTVYTVVIGT